MTTTIEAHRLVRRFGRFRALDGLDLVTRPGVTGLLGPNGAGKTTLLRVLATVTPHDEGTLRVLGHDPSTDVGRLAVRRSLGYLPQDAGFHPGFTVFEAVDYVAVLKEHTRSRARHDEVRRVLGLVGLSDVATSKVRTLSGGMRRRLGLAQALLGTPDLLVLDEPTVGLDPEQRIRFRDLVAEAGHGRTVVLSTHQTEDVAAVCSHVVVVNRGQSLFDGTVEELTALAEGRVWLDDRRDPRAQAAWRLSGGVFHHVGDPPAGAELVAPAIEDAYLLLLGPDATQESAA
ncbi:ATP-binding cassette domain-containing protein [Nocardioides marmoribigeumensis]|uniref:ABC-2 type transport system ATP-binding protein n=1 Tax=Nocardioides marmoribigeumensis TaxID=433649 RepID=A0ABU2BWN0_9ACTN|nr:ATP-binding cassette domain-containing protein [Nocardioides marmoribigeumensis]MDR7361924.1 ABC-2 type transport system ATP-binding protein [Nocardioides marmoribigeumensis]